LLINIQLLHFFSRCLQLWEHQRPNLLLPCRL